MPMTLVNNTKKTKSKDESTMMIDQLLPKRRARSPETVSAVA